ncbi:hypothetical protein GJ744_000498 [Endocarpon pusillum]|uniref:Heterokaryon incompatibility domain-containing protein n=1 Tax=Endocarpon pusillum TaxID=364733 RepID=A0A8H7AEQ7_9EURO|nr:hypothetical protein GJ744_000498 [Endocarpon pusillum]
MLTIQPPWKRFPATSADYEYNTLNTQRNEIRLLKIRPSLRSKDPISCSLRVVSFDDVSLPKYVALSYCWGNGRADQPIHCDGSIIRVTSDLLDALRSLRKLSRRYLWIDQICVNQEDLEERSSQVSLMRRIYPGAFKTFLHLGPDDDFPCRPPDWLRLVLPLLIAGPWSGLAMMRGLSRLLMKSGVDGFESRMEAFIDRPCYHRAWIIQEMSLSSNVEVICGNITITWNQFAGLANDYFAECVQHAKVFPGTAYGIFGDYYNVTKPGRKQGTNTLWSLLILSNGVKASDPRDQIYTLLTLASDTSDFPLPDYQLPVTKVFQDFATVLITKNHGPAMLSLSSCRAKDFSYPSWVPDWEQEFIGLRLEEFSTFSAGSPNGSFNVQTGNYLSTKGLIVDKILWVYSHREEEDFNAFEIFEKLLDLVNNTAAAIQNEPEVLRSGFSWSSVVDLHLMLILYLVFDHEGGVLSENLRRGYDDKGYNFMKCLQQLAQRGRFAITVAGRLCLMPQDVRPGDRIAIILGCRAPYVLREDGDGDVFVNIGETYIRGLMNGEVLGDERYKVQEIHIH